MWMGIAIAVLAILLATIAATRIASADKDNQFVSEK